MEADWDEVGRIVHPLTNSHGLPTGITTLAFDSFQELLWTGNEAGRIASFYGPELQKHTSFRAHASNGAVKQLLFTEKGVISLSQRSIHMSLRRGLTQWHLEDERFEDLYCMSFAAKGQHEILVAGCQGFMFRIDVEKGTVTDALPAADNYTMMKRGGQYICAATNTGSVHILDPATFKVVKVWKAHNAWINDMDAKSDYLVTCGFSSRQQLGFLLDPLANVFDLKTLVPLPPIPFHPGAAWVRMHPRMSTTSLIASQAGQMQVIDIMNPNSVNLRQANIYDSHLTALEIAPSGEAVALADDRFHVQLWGSPTKMQFAEYSNPTIFADTATPLIPPPSLTSMDWFQAPDAPLNAIAVPQYREQLLSAWPAHAVFEVGAAPTPIDPVVMKSLKRADLGGYAPNHRKGPRNQAPVVIDRKLASAQPNNALPAPKFLSEKAREVISGAVSTSDADGDVKDALDVLAELGLDTHGNGSDHPTKLTDVPAMYRNVEIKYSKFGVDDFDFEFFNKTNYSGLETDVANHFINPLLQLFKYTPVIRNLALHHTATSCLFESCLLCEMGFLFDMLEKANGQNCHSTNLLRAFGSLSNTSSLGLLEEHSQTTPLTVMIQTVNRFLLDKIAADYRQMSPQVSRMDQALTTVFQASIRCAFCTNEIRRPGSTYAHDLLYPPKSSPKQPIRAPRPIFSQILKASVERQEQHRAWCDRCKRYQQLSTRKSIQSVPAVLTINANVGGSEAKQLWATPGWLPQEIGIIVDQGQFFCYEGQDLKLHLQRGVYNITVYELVGVVADINSGENQKSHLVSMINVAPSSRDPHLENQWYLFNDFLVRQTTREEALRFEPSWKLPSVLTYQIKSASHAIDDTWKDNLDPSLLYRRWSTLQDSDPTKFRVLNPHTESPRPGVPVAIDGEFVELRRAEKEYKADGTCILVRPALLTLARVSVLRGSGPDAGLPFIDDYIAVHEPIVDYHTEHSGISPGDLDRSTSRHTLVGLKVAYKKLWILLNLGAVFVGHGLAKDFRIINLHVPRPRQVVDTVDIYYLAHRHRRLSLKFLAAYFLKELIQTAMHDSVEDARTALRLWRRWQDLTADDDVNGDYATHLLEECYAEGRRTGFKVPGAAGTDSGVGSGPAAATAGATAGRATPEPETLASIAATGAAAVAAATGGEKTSSSATTTPGRATPSRVGFGAVKGRGPAFGGSPLR